MINLNPLILIKKNLVPLLCTAALIHVLVSCAKSSVPAFSSSASDSPPLSSWRHNADILGKAICAAIGTRSPATISKNERWKYSYHANNAIAKLKTELYSTAIESSNELDCIEKYYAKSNRKVSITEYGESGFNEAYSGAKIYKIFDITSGTLLEITKIYPSNEATLIFEISSHDFFHHHKWQNFKHAKILDIGICNLGQKHIWFSIQSGLPGKTLARMLFDASSTLDSYSTLFDQLKLAFNLTGKALAELHNKTPIPKTTIHPNFSSLINGNIESLNTRLMGHDDGDKFFSDISEKKNSFLTGDTIRTYIHGDFHPGNILFDGNSKLVAFIDLEETHKSIADNGQPIGLPELDIAHFTEFLLKWKNIGNLTSESIDNLLIEFQNGYGNNSIAFSYETNKKLLSWYMKLTKSCLAGT